jgi:tRNA (cmo5U34)-methyltransferase
MNKSTVKQIQERFDGEVERFSNLETGQSATIDAPLTLALIAEAAARVTPAATSLLDVGCGAGNYSLKILKRLPNLDVTLVDLSERMLERAVERVSRATSGKVTALQGDIRELQFGNGRFDIICAAAVLHHLREEAEWRSVFSKFYALLKPGGSFWISDLIEHSDSRVQALMWERYGKYLTQLKSDEYRDQVFAYIAQEDTPRPLMFQVDLLRSVGFGDVEILHKNSCFAAFGAIKGTKHVRKRRAGTQIAIRTIADSRAPQRSAGRGPGRGDFQLEYHAF